MLLVVAATGMELCSALGSAGAWEQGRVAPAEAHGRPVLALATGIGVVNAALALGRALERGGVSGVLDVGVAGSFDLDAHPLRAVRLVEREDWPEFGLLESGRCAADAQALGFPLAEAGGERIFGRLAWDASAELARLGLDPAGLPAAGLATATSLTVSGVTADGKRAAELFSRFGAGLENMEGFALAYACRQAGLPFAELRAVSNRVGSRPPRDWDLAGALGALGGAARRLLAQEAL